MNVKQKDYAASVLARLLNHSRTHKEEYQSLLIRYVAERFLYRLGQSEYPAPISRNFPSLLGFNSPNIVFYPIKTVIAKKLETIIALSLLTSRMKDFYNLYVISYSSNGKHLLVNYRMNILICSILQ